LTATNDLITFAPEMGKMNKRLTEMMVIIYLNGAT